MGVHFERIVVAVPDLDAAADEYRQLLGVQPLACESPRALPAVRWDLGNVLIELEQAGPDQPRLQAVALYVPGAPAREHPVANTLGIDVRASGEAASVHWRAEHPQAQVTGLSVDHLVLHSHDAHACIDLFAGQLGIRLALDKSAPQWGGRMLFFRAGRMTLEVLVPDAQPAGGSCFWGLAYACADLRLQVRALQERGVAVSAVRDGRKPGTQVATVKSHCLGIPTLLIQPAR